MKTAWNVERVLREAHAWVWAPPGTSHLREDWQHSLVPDSGDTITVEWVDLERPAPEVAERLRRLMSDHGKHQISIRTSDATRPADLESWLVANGAEYVEATEVMAWDLTARDLPEAEPHSVELVETIDQWLEWDAAARATWGGEPPTAEATAAQEAELSRPIAERGGFAVLVRIDGVPATTAGVTLAGEVARLWGAATVPALRGRGGYRASVRGRLAIAREHGATLGLTNALVDTSAPVLDRLGFTR